MWLSRDAPVHIYITVSQDSSKYITILRFPKIPFCIHICFSLKWQFFLCVNISISIEASLLILIIGLPRITFSICSCFDLRNAHLCMPMSGSLNMLPYIPSYCGLQGNPSPDAYIWDSKSPCIRVSKDASLYMPILRVFKYTYIYMPIFGSQRTPMPIPASLKMLHYTCQYYIFHRCPFLYAYICG
jgi:hypothetical protein